MPPKCVSPLWSQASRKFLGEWRISGLPNRKLCYPETSGGCRAPCQSSTAIRFRASECAGSKYVSFRFVQSWSDPAHDSSRPIQRLSSLSTTENHEIIRIVHYLSLKEFALSRDPPVLQKTVHVQVCQQGTAYSLNAKDNLSRRVSFQTLPTIVSYQRGRRCWAVIQNRVTEE